MGFFGAVIGGTIGFFLGGPPSAALGAAAGGVAGEAGASSGGGDLGGGSSWGSSSSNTSSAKTSTSGNPGRYESYFNDDDSLKGWEDRKRLHSAGLARAANNK
jgi:hypothetical protein